MLKVKTLNREKSEELFRQINSLANRMQLMAAAVQNPDFVDMDNVEENYRLFYNDYVRITSELARIKEDVYKIHQDVMNFTLVP